MNHTLGSGIEEMHKIAESRKGKCLSDKYVNNRTKLRWQCKEGHEWHATPSHIKSGEWCPECAGNVKRNIVDMQILARGRGGICLSKEYRNNKTKLKWQCKEGHRWWASPSKVLQGQWCRLCSGQRKWIIADMRKIARERGGKCLSSQYLGYEHKLKWICVNKHTWESTPDNIIHGKWCPYCQNNVKEALCRCVLERIFHADFPITKPKWLVSPNGTRMHLDGFNRKLQIAFEYQGSQHYREHKYFGRNMSLKTRQKYDREKQRLCKKHNIALIRIPYTTRKESIYQKIIEQCSELNVSLPPHKKINVNLLNPYPDKLKKIIRIAESKAGKCLSRRYIDSVTKLTFECKEGHRWQATVGSRSGAPV